MPTASAARRSWPAASAPARCRRAPGDPVCPRRSRSATSGRNTLRPAPTWRCSCWASPDLHECSPKPGTIRAVSCRAVEWRQGAGATGRVRSPHGLTAASRRFAPSLRESARYCRQTPVAGDLFAATTPPGVRSRQQIRTFRPGDRPPPCPRKPAFRESRRGPGSVFAATPAGSLRCARALARPRSTCGSAPALPSRPAVAL